AIRPLDRWPEVPLGSAGDRTLHPTASAHGTREGARLIQALLPRLGLDRPELRAWAMYDWANSAFVTTIVAAVFPVYFASVAGADLPPATATGRFAAATTLSKLVVAVMAPVLGALADYAAVKKRMLAAFMALR